jgi:hypothetical protein
MAMDYLLWTGDAEKFAPYLKIPLQAANYFMQHYAKNAEGTKVVVYPAQVLETWWCTWDTTHQNFTNCCADDSPTISGMQTLFSTLLALPPSLTTPEQRAQWQAFVPLIPELPTDAGRQNILPARVLSSSSHNSEGPELYSQCAECCPSSHSIHTAAGAAALCRTLPPHPPPLLSYPHNPPPPPPPLSAGMHPHRVFTMGKHVATGFDISLGQSTFKNSRWSGHNEGWNYGLNAAALIGDAATAAALLLERARQGPAPGYRWAGFAPHMQDFDPSADFFANANRCLQEMLIQSGDDGFVNPTIVLFPAWPCEWDASFKLWGPLNTTLDVVYQGGKLVSLVVDPPARAASVKWANCVSNS